MLNQTFVRAAGGLAESPCRWRLSHPTAELVVDSFQLYLVMDRTFMWNGDKSFGSGIDLIKLYEAYHFHGDSSPFFPENQALFLFDKAQCFQSARWFGAVGWSPDVSRVFSWHLVSRHFRICLDTLVMYDYVVPRPTCLISNHFFSPKKVKSWLCWRSGRHVRKFNFAAFLFFSFFVNAKSKVQHSAIASGLKPLSKPWTFQYFPNSQRKSWHEQNIEKVRVNLVNSLFLVGLFLENQSERAKTKQESSHMLRDVTYTFWSENRVQDCAARPVAMAAGRRKVIRPVIMTTGRRS